MKTEENDVMKEKHQRNEMAKGGAMKMAAAAK